MRYVADIDGKSVEVDRFAAVALSIIRVVIQVQGRPVTRQVTVWEQLHAAARHFELSDDMDPEAASIVRAIIEMWGEPKSKRRAQHLRVVRTHDPDGSPSPQAGP
mgnify:CR=1 FL=1|jgi:hypothetical protein